MTRMKYVPAILSAFSLAAASSAAMAADQPNEISIESSTAGAQSHSKTTVKLTPKVKPVAKPVSTSTPKPSSNIRYIDIHQKFKIELLAYTSVDSSVKDGREIRIAHAHTKAVLTQVKTLPSAEQQAQEAKETQLADGSHKKTIYVDGKTTEEISIDTADDANADAAAVSKPAPTAVEAPRPPTGPMPGLDFKVFNAKTPFNLGMGNITHEEADSLIAQSGCNKENFFENAKHLVNAKCVEFGLAKSVNLQCILGVNSTGQTVCVSTGPATISSQESVHTEHGQGWLIPFSVAFGTFGNLFIQAENLRIATLSLKNTENLNNQIIYNLKAGKITSLFGNLNCGNASVSNGATGKIAATCVVNSNVVNSGIGQDSSATTSGASTTIGTSPVSMIIETVRPELGSAGPAPRVIVAYG